MPKAIAFATAVPANVYGQDEIREFASSIFAPRLAFWEKLARVFDNAAIERRHFVMPLEWYAEEHGYKERNELFYRHGSRLALDSLAGCLDRIGLDPSDVDHVVFITSTGVSTPTIDAFLFNRLRMRSDLVRTPIWGMGCLGGAVGLSRARDFALAHSRASVAVVTVEICSLAFQLRDETPKNIVATALFSDGAAAAVVVGPDHPLHARPGFRLRDALSTTYPGSMDVMGWEIVDTGFKVMLSRQIPAIVRDHIADGVTALMERNDLKLEDVSFFAVHPGGVKILDAYERALGVGTAATSTSRLTLRLHGNMSSPTVLFVLERILESAPRGAGKESSLGLVSAFGPGFGSELIVVERG